MPKTSSKKVICCGWAPLDKPDYLAYHDHEWGVPVHDDTKLFEMLILEGAQAGLSWYTILQRRAGYKKVFKNFNPKRVASMTDTELKVALTDERIIRNRLKVFGARQNARVFLAIQKEFGSFNTYLWGFVGGKPIVHRPKTITDIPSGIPASHALSRDLKRRGMTFVGESIIYAYMQATGLVDDHVRGCVAVKYV